MAGKKDKEPNIDKLTFEQAVEKLEDIVEKIETGQTGLEEAISEYELGCKLIQRCKTILSEAERKIEMLNKELSGQLTPQNPPDDFTKDIDNSNQ